MSNSEMPNQIQDLIANIQEKFDSEFNQHTQQSSPIKNDIQNKQVKDNANPQSDRQNLVENSDLKIKSPPQQQIIIYEAHQNQENSHMERQESDLNKKIQLENQIKQPFNNQQIEEQDENKYKDLSQKLETALKKISSSKKGFHTHNSFNVTSDFLSRVQQYERKKQKDLQVRRKMEQQKKTIGFKQKPDINAKSRQMAQQISHRPIYERFDQIVQEKKKKIQSNQQNKKQLQQQEYQKFMQQYKKHVKTPQNCRDSQTYFQDMMTWKKKLQKQREDKAKQLQQKQKQGYTFKPELNKKSVRMLKNQKRVPIQDRQIERPKTQQSEFSFQPKINKRKFP